MGQMVTATHETGSDAASVAAIPGLDPLQRRTIDTAVRTGAELMRLRVLKILSAELDNAAALRVAELVMQVEV